MKIDYRTNDGVIVFPQAYYDKNNNQVISFSTSITDPIQLSKLYNNYIIINGYDPLTNSTNISDIPSWLTGLLIQNLLYHEGIITPTYEQFNNKSVELGFNII